MKPTQKLNSSMDGFLSSISLVGAIVVLFVSPVNLDPVNVPKMSILAILAGVNLAYAAGNLNLRNFPIKIKLILSILMVGLLIPMIFSDSPVLQQFYGVFGRNSGFLTYFSFILIFILNYRFRNFLLINRTVNYLFLAGVINLIIGITEVNGINFFGLENIFNRPLGTFGNPDFYCAFLAIIISLILPNFASQKVSIIKKAVYGVYTFLSLWIMTISNIRQAQIMSLAGISIFIYILLRNSSRVSKIVKKSTAFVLSAVVSLVLLGALNQGPLASLIYKRTMGFRIEYWKTSLNMFLAHPFFGTGLDGYSDNFERYRPKNTYQVLGNVEYANASHNVFLDYLSGGGLILAIGYFLLVLLTFKSVLKIFRNSKIDDPMVGVALAWVLFQIQSFVSIGQIGISILGWIFSGLILSLDSKDAVSDQSKFVLNIDAKILVVTFLGIFISLGLSLPPSVIDAKWKSAVISQNGEQIFTLAQTWPYDSTRLIKAAEAFSNAGYEAKSLRLIRFAINFNPESLKAWQILLDQPLATLDEKQKAELKIKSLADTLQSS